MTKTIPACTFAAALALALGSTVAVAGDMKTHAGASESVAQSMMKDKMGKKGDAMMKDGMKKDGMKHDVLCKHLREITSENHDSLRVGWTSKIRFSFNI
jgi:pentapeptide MXKDX repeat protein